MVIFLPSKLILDNVYCVSTNINQGLFLFTLKEPKVESFSADLQYLTSIS